MWCVESGPGAPSGVSAAACARGLFCSDTAAPRGFFDGLFGLVVEAVAIQAAMGRSQWGGAVWCVPFSVPWFFLQKSLSEIKKEPGYKLLSSLLTFRTVRPELL